MISSLFNPEVEGAHGGEVSSLVAYKVPRYLALGVGTVCKM